MHRRSVTLTLITSLTLSLPALAQWTNPVDPAATHSIPAFEVPPVQPQVAYERFMVIGDFGTGRADQRVVADVMAVRAKRDGLDFILTTGDNVYQDGVTSIDDPQWKAKLTDMYADAALQVPMYASLGNHDHRGSIKAQIAYSDKNPNWQMPAPYYTFSRTLADGTRVQFFAIDSTPIAGLEPAAEGTADREVQLKWLDEALARSDARWKIVFGHHPLFAHSIRGPGKTMIERLEPLLVKHAVDLYFAGHDHTLEMLKPVKGVHYVVSGAAAGADKAYGIEWTDEAFYAATRGGFAFVRISKDEVVIEFVRLDAETQYAHVLRK